MFDSYPSNIPLGTGHNHILRFESTRRLTARAYFRCLSYSSDTWRFWFSNAVDSTFGGMEYEAFRDQPGGNYTILSARIGDGGPYEAHFMDTPVPVQNWTEVTFDGGNPHYEVSPCERFWSDEVSFSLPEDHLLVWEWELEGNDIPCTPDSQAATFVSYNEEALHFDLMCPMPDLIGTKRPVKNRIAFWGDSITQGCGTGNNLYEMWAARIALTLGGGYGFWNIGLGWARGSDAADGTFWKYKAAQADTVCIVHGVNDIISGRYGKGQGDSADEIITTLEKNIRELQSKGIRVILFTIPPFDYADDRYMVWKTLRYAYPALACELDVELFDFSAALDADHPYGNKYPYGAHPNGEGGRLAAEAFLRAKLID